MRRLADAALLSLFGIKALALSADNALRSGEIEGEYTYRERSAAAGARIREHQLHTEWIV